MKFVPSWMSSQGGSLPGGASIKKITLIAFVFFVVVTAVAASALVSSLELGFLFSTPLALVYVLFVAILPVVSPAILAALLYKVRYYSACLCIILLSLGTLVLSWHFAHKSEIFFSIYKVFYSTFDAIGIPRIPQGTLIPNESSFPPGIHSFDRTPFLDRYYLRANYPAYQLEIRGGAAVIVGLNKNIEYSYYPGRQCTDIREIPKSSDTAYKDAVFQNIQCHENLTCSSVNAVRTVHSLVTKRLFLSLDNSSGCAFVETDSFEGDLFSESMLLNIMNTAASTP